MNKEQISFLLRAKKATYAGKGPESEPSRPKSHDLHYEEDSLKYIDTYLGGEKFAGEEAVWENGVPIWALNYVGRVLGDDFSGDFLKEALSMASDEQPYRGPGYYMCGNYTYARMTDGNIHWFSGYEEIRFKDEKVYECLFHGGDIK